MKVAHTTASDKCFIQKKKKIFGNINRTSGIHNKNCAQKRPSQYFLQMCCKFVLFLFFCLPFPSRLVRAGHLNASILVKLFAEGFQSQKNKISSITKVASRNTSFFLVIARRNYLLPRHLFERNE